MAIGLLSGLTGCLDQSHGRDLLFIGTGQTVQAYDVHQNSDVFFRDVPEGVGCLMVGTCNEEMLPLLYVGSSLCVFGLDSVGKEQMWTVSNDDVAVLASGDADGDGKHEILAGTSSGDILVFKQVSPSVSWTGTRGAGRDGRHLAWTMAVPNNVWSIPAGGADCRA